MRREKEIEERKAERRRGVIKAGGAITWSQGNAHATGRCILRQPVKVSCTVPCNAPATLYATFHDTYGGKPATLQYDRDNKLIVLYEKEQTKVAPRTVFLRT